MPEKSIIVTYKDMHELIFALNINKINYALVDNAAAEYWHNHSSGIIEPIATPFNFGFGIGIAINPQNTTLTEQVNIAVMQYVNTLEFSKIHNMYFDDLFVPKSYNQS